MGGMEQEVGARTLRPKIQRHLPKFLEKFPALAKHPHAWPAPIEVCIRTPDRDQGTRCPSKTYTQLRLGRNQPGYFLHCSYCAQNTFCAPVFFELSFSYHGLACMHQCNLSVGFLELA